MPVLSLFGAAFLWGMIGPISKYVFNVGISPLEAAFWRSLTAGILFFIHAASNRKLFVARKDWFALIIFSIFGVASLESLFLFSVSRVGAGLASILLYSAPAWVALFSKLFLNETLTRSRILALLLIWIGIAGASLSQQSQSLHFDGLGILFGLISGLSYALFYLFGKKYFTRYQPTTLFGYAFTIGAIVMLPGIQFTTSKSIMTWGLMIGLGMFSTYLAYFLYSEGLKKMDATRASLIASLEPVVSIFFAHLLWNESFGFATLSFSSLVIIGVILSGR